MHALRRVSASSSLTTAASSASAQDFEAGAAIGPYASFTFGDEVGVGYGIDITILFSEGDRCDRLLGGGFGVGPTIQVGGVNLERRVAVRTRLRRRWVRAARR